jgi:anaerobic selenocysteine-containing dehydrogenase
MKVNRRDFIKLGAAAATIAAVGGGSRMIKAMELQVAGSDYSAGTGEVREKVHTMCFVCNIQDGAVAYKENGRIVKLEGNPLHPGTRGRMCPKGNSGMLHTYNPDRILYPMRRVGKRGEGKFKRISWDEALDEMASRLREIIDKGNPKEIIFHHGRSRISALEKRFLFALGSASQWNHTSICEASKKVGMETTWGPDIEFPDFTNSNYIILFGGNVLEASYFMNPYAQRLSDGKVANKAKVVSFDVRLSNSQAFSDEAFYIKPGTDGAVALAMANVIMQEGLYDAEFIERHTNVSVEDLKRHLAPYTPEWASKHSDVPAADIRRIAVEFATAGKATVFTYRGPCMHENCGAIAERCIMLLPIITGNVEKEGGYLLPRGMGPGEPKPYPPKPGLPNDILHPPEYPLASHGVSQQLPHRIKRGDIRPKFYWNYHIDQVYAFPDGGVWEEVFSDESMVAFIVHSDLYMNETALYADIILPDATYLELSEPDSMPSAEVPWVGMRQRVIEPLGESKSTQTVILELGRRIDPDGSRGIRRYFEWKDDVEWTKAAFEQWDNPEFKAAGGYEFLKKHGVWPTFEVDPNTGRSIDPRTKKEVRADYGWPEGKVINIFSEEIEEAGFAGMPFWIPNPGHRNLRDNELILTTFKKVMHTQSASQNLKWLQEIDHDNPAWINSATARKLGLRDGDLVRVTSPIGYMVTKVHVTEGIRPECIAIAHHAGHWHFGRYAEGKRGYRRDWSREDDPDSELIWWEDVGVHPNKIIPVYTDPVGGSQGWFDTIVRVEPAKPGDRYGDFHYDTSKSMEVFRETLKWTTPEGKARIRQLIIQERGGVPPVKPSPKKKLEKPVEAGYH